MLEGNDSVIASLYEFCEIHKNGGTFRVRVAKCMGYELFVWKECTLESKAKKVAFTPWPMGVHALAILFPCKRPIERRVPCARSYRSFIDWIQKESH
mgnify:FL=1